MIVIYPKESNSVSEYKLLSDLFAPIPSMSNLPSTESHLQRHANESSNADTTTIAYCDSTKREFPLFFGDLIADLSEGIHIYSSTQKSLPEYDGKYDPYCGNEIEQCLQYQKPKIHALE